MNLVNHVTQQFSQLVNCSPEFVVRAPGRVNLIGEHTDYNDGFVLPCAINYDTVIACSPRSDRQIHVVALDYHNEEDIFSLDAPIAFEKQKMWCNYIRGVVNVFLSAGATLTGMDLVISGNVPQGAGLSSSASLEVAVGYALKAINRLTYTPTDIAKMGQKAENQFVGCNCGIMDQLISALGEQHHSLLIDCRSLETQLVSVPKNMTLMIINSNVRRGLVSSEYNVRRQQCEAVARHFNVKALRDVSLEQLFIEYRHLDTVSAKRARHVITDNMRTLSAAMALAENNIAELSHLMALSHQSMKNDFEITVPPIDLLVDEIQQEIGFSGGVRMTGGGFGGCVVALVPTDGVEAVRQRVNGVYHAKTGLKETIYLCQASEGAEVLKG